MGRVAVGVLLVVAACTPRISSSGEAGPPPASEASVADAARDVVDAAAGAADSAPPTLAPHGTAGLVIEHVEAVCMVGMGANGLGHFTVGLDVIVEISFDDAATSKPARDHVFCSSHLADGGETKPRLGIWRNCREDKSCKDVTEAGAGATEVQCGKDRVRLEVQDGRTLLRGGFGERVIAPFPMRIAPTRRTKRNANVDC